MKKLFKTSLSVLLAVLLILSTLSAGLGALQASARVRLRREKTFTWGAGRKAG